VGARAAVTGTVGGMNIHRIRSADQVRRLLAGALEPVSAYFCAASTCQECNRPVGTGQVNLVVDVSGESAAARVVHRPCKRSEVRDVVALPLSPHSSYQYRTVALPGNVRGQNTTLPTVLLRMAVDVALLSRVDGRWRLTDVSLFDNLGFTPLVGELPTASDTCHATLTETGVRLDLGGDVIAVTDPGLAAASGVAGAVLVVSATSGDMDEVNDQQTLVGVFRHPGTRAAFVDVRDTEASGG
jgi:hypothetical protein